MEDRPLACTRKWARLREGDATSPYVKRPPIVWLATENRHKYLEANAILSAYDIPLRQLKVEKVELQSSRLEDVAVYALNQLSKYWGSRLVIVEDSGLFINTLDGFPGPFSSYVRKTLGLDGVLQLMENHRDRTAFFKAAIAMAGPKVKPRLFTGMINGKIAKSSRGTGGFGFDPIFIPDRGTLTFAESSENFKNRQSHRGRALSKLARWYTHRFRLTS